MLFAEMIQELVAGKQMVRKSWAPNDGYLAFLPGMKSVWKILTQPAPNAGNHLFSVEEFLADDWEVANHAPKVEEAEVQV